MLKGWLGGSSRAAQTRMVLDGSFSYPVATLNENALAHNIATMAAYCDREDVLIAPHAKTTMAPTLLRRQLDAGAWALTVATWTQARTCWEQGFQRLLIANELVSDAEIEWLARSIAAAPPNAFAIALVDSEAGVARLDAIAGRVARDVLLDVLVEVGYVGGRCGCRTLADVLLVAEHVARSPRLRLAGVSGYEGLIAATAGPSELTAVDTFLSSLASAARALADRGLVGTRAPLLSAGGSAFFDRVVATLKAPAQELGGRIVLRGGCYIAHDHGLYERLSPNRRIGLEPFRAALEIWGAVLSRPEPTQVIVGLGKRDIAFDTDLPQPLGSFARDGQLDALGTARTTALNDQHAHLRVDPKSRLRPGDLVGFGASHPCATFDRWSVLALVDDDYRLLGPVSTCF